MALRKTSKVRQHATKGNTAKTSPPRSVSADLVVQHNLGLPSRENFAVVEKEYIDSLSYRKREKALISQDMFDAIWDVLHEPGNATIRTAQFRFWVRKMFTLSYVHRDIDKHEDADDDVDVQPVVLHENLPVALKSQIYDILNYCHQLAGHGGRDRTMAKLRERYSWVPKELVSKYVRICPTCVYKKSANMDVALSLRSSDSAEHPLDRSAHALDDRTNLQVPKPQLAPNGTRRTSTWPVDHILVPGHPEGSMDTKIRLPLKGGTPLPPISTFLSHHAPDDASKWLTDLMSLPGPSTIVLPALILKDHQETASDQPAARITLPPLMQALSDPMLDYVTSFARPPHPFDSFTGTDSAMHIQHSYSGDSLSGQSSDSSLFLDYSLTIDPLLLREDEMAVESQSYGKAAGLVDVDERVLSAFGESVCLPPHRIVIPDVVLAA